MAFLFNQKGQGSKKSRRDELLEHRSTLMDEYQKTSEGFDRTIITLASSALGISVAFLNDIVPERDPNTLPILGAAWILIGLSLAAIVFSFLFAIKSRKSAIRDIDLVLRGGTEKETKYPRTATALSWVSAITLILGIFLYLVFAVMNL
ncbi:MAG: hypothetical protein M1347_04420 [Chloroflexi bacterium]|nr:hypothetical protein [Chloroflexota bacterium]